MVKGVFFDAGNTVVFPDYNIYRGIAAEFGAEATIEQVVVAEAGARGAFDAAVSASPGNDVSGYWTIYYTPFYLALGVPSSSIGEAIERTREANDTDPGIWVVPVEGLDETVGALRKRDLAVGIVSNTDGRLDGRLRQIGIRDYFDFVIDSVVVGVSKPDARIFELALDEVSLAAHEVVFVGDYYVVDIVGARNVGMTPVLFDPQSAYGDVDCKVIARFDDIVPMVDRLNGGAE